MDIHVYLHQDSTQQMFQQILQKLNQIQQGEIHMSAELDALTAQVAQNTTVEGSALTLIQGLAAQLAAAIAAGNPAALTALQTQLNTSATALAAAVAANTAPAAASAS